MKLLARIDDRAAGLAEVGDVVERVVEAEDVDAVLGCAGDEPSHDVFRDRLGADEEATAEGDPERCLRTGAECANPLPWALDSLCAPPRRTLLRRTPRGTRTRLRRGSRRYAEPRRSAPCRRTAPARAGGSWCRRAWACGVRTLPSRQEVRLRLGRGGCSPRTSFIRSRRRGASGVSLRVPGRRG